VCRQLELALRGMFPRAAVFPFGSSVNGFGQKGGDQDMVLVLDNSQAGWEFLCGWGRWEGELLVHPDEHFD